MLSIARICLLITLLGGLSACDSENTADEQGSQSSTEISTKSTGSASPAAIDNPEAKTLLKKALSNMGALKSAHAEATLVAGKNTIPMHAELGTGAVDLTIDRADGIKARHMVVGDKEVVSLDGGKTWAPDTEHNGNNMSSLLTFVFTPATGALTQGPVSLVGKEAINGKDSTHLHINAGKDSSPVDIWVSEDPALGPVISRYKGIMGGNDMEFDATLDYSKFNQPVTIKLPG